MSKLPGLQKNISRGTTEPMKKHKAKKHTKKNKGFSLIELLIVVAIILIIAAIAIPNLLRSRIAANEASAVGSLRTLNTAEVTYNTTYGTFTCTMSDLGGTGTPSSTAAGLIDYNLAQKSKSGYNFEVQDCGAQKAQYETTAKPITVSTTGQRGFCSDSSGVIQQTADGTAPTTLDTCQALNKPI
jgi:prepilin-type N-terminal cleavage/methylation domain-containing protein